MRFVNSINGRFGRAIVETRTVVAGCHDGRFEILRRFGEISGGGQVPALNEERAA
jgi:hypothetical protein